jgi:hypothetical protein
MQPRIFRRESYSNRRAMERRERMEGWSGRRERSERDCWVRIFKSPATAGVKALVSSR